MVSAMNAVAATSLAAIVEMKEEGEKSVTLHLIIDFDGDMMITL